jgi:hypothetical protein
LEKEADAAQAAANFCGGEKPAKLGFEKFLF